MIKYADAARRLDLATHGQSRSRVYIDPRGIIYPPATTTALTYSAITLADNQPGTHNVGGGDTKYVLPLPDTLSAKIRFKPTFAYDDGSDQPLLSWYVDANRYLTLFYSAANDDYELKWKDGGTERTMATVSTYTTTTALQVWTDIDFIVDLAVDQSEGFYLNRVAEDTSWSDAIDIKTTAFPFMELRAENAAQGGYVISHVRLFPDKKASATEVAANYSTLKEEEIYWGLNGEGCGRTRCNITDKVQLISSIRGVENEDWMQMANRATIELNNQDAEFSDEQYNAFDPTAGYYNGTAAQKYLQKRFGVSIESWYSNTHDPVFVGRLSVAKIMREAAVNTVAIAILDCEDYVGELARKKVTYAKRYDGYEMCYPTDESTSLLHSMVRLDSRKTVYNYLANSSFESASALTSWAVAGAGATFARTSNGCVGDYAGLLTMTSTLCSFSQTIMFDDQELLDVGDIFTFAIAVQPVSAALVSAATLISVAENDAGGENDATTQAVAKATEDGFEYFEIAHTITDGDSDRLVVMAQLTEEQGVKYDGAMLVKAKRAPKFFSLNDNEGVAGVEDADDKEGTSYDTVGFDVNEVSSTLTAVLITDDEPLWEYMKDFAIGSLTSYIGMSSEGTFKYRSRFKDGYSDPSALATVVTASEIATELKSLSVNKVTTHGVIITISSHLEWLWDARATGNWKNQEDGLSLNEEVVDNAIWPAPAEFGDFWAKYIKIASYKGDKSFFSGGNPATGWGTNIINAGYPYTTKDKDAPEIVGATSLELIYKDITLTETVFDTTTDAQQARIKLTNSTGSTVRMRQCAIKGIPTYRTPWQKGYAWEKIDEEDILNRGEIKFEIGNDFIQSKAQCEKLGDYWWKYLGADPKHRYSLILPGELHYFEPGEWYVVQIGSAGDPDYLDFTGICHTAEIERGFNDIGSTLIEFREVYENWSKTLNTLARTISTGWITDLPTQSTVRVAASTYVGEAAYYCDGVADEVQINAAIAALVASNGGGIIELTEGTFNIAAAIAMESTIILRGAGHNTIIDKDFADYAITMVGTAGTHKTNMQLKDFKVTRSDTEGVGLILVDYCDDFLIDNIWCYNSIRMGLWIVRSGRFIVQNSIFERCGVDTSSSSGDGILISSASLHEARGIIRDNVCTANYLAGIKIGHAYSLVVDSNRCYLNLVYGIYMDDSENCDIRGNVCQENIYGIYLYENANKNKIDGNTFYRNYRYGFDVGISTALDNMFTNNNLIDNGNFVSGFSDRVGTIDTTHLLAACTVAVDTDEFYTPAYNSVKSLLMTKAVSAGTAGTYDLVDSVHVADMHGLIANYSYRFAIKAMIPTSGGCAVAEARIGIGQYHGAAWNWSYSVADISALDTWEDLDTEAIVLSSSTTGINVRVEMESAAANAEKIYLDNLVFHSVGHESHGGREGDPYGMQYADAGTRTYLH